MKCEKIRYFSKSDGKYAIKQLQYTGVKRIYECEECRKLGMGRVWHLTSKENRYEGKRISNRENISTP